MQSSLLLNDTKKFVDKYTKFLTKDIYISQKMNEDFIKNYKYLVLEFEKTKYLYQDQDIYKKFRKIIDKNSELLKFHNQKYLKNALARYEDFFEKLTFEDTLDKNMKLMILAFEERMVLVVNKIFVPFVAIKIKYMIDYLKKDKRHIKVLVKDQNVYQSLKKEFEIYRLGGVSLEVVSDLENDVLKDKEVIIDKSVLYQELFQYIIHDIYSDKAYREEFYKAFSSYIYLNRDYKDFDTFKDYHYYMYKRKYLESHLSLKKYNEKEIKLRKRQLRTINNCFVSCKEMVDVGNFLFLNSVDFTYDKDGDYYLCCSKNKKIIIKFMDNDNDKYDYEVIYLNKRDKFLEQLVYELIKRQYGMEKCSDEIIYSSLRDTSMDSYFSEFISYKLIPSIEYYSKYKNYDDTKYNNKQKEILVKIYNYYENFMKKNSYVDYNVVHERVQDKIDKMRDDYFVLVGSVDYQFYQYCMVIDEYPALNISDNVRIFYDYKKYLNQNKLLALPHTYYGMEEIYKLRGEYIKEYLVLLNEKIDNSDKKVYICFYSDNSRLKSSMLLNERIYDIVSSIDRDMAFFIENREEIKNILVKGYFSKVSNYEVSCVDKVIPCSHIYLDKDKYSYLIIPFLVKDQYHDDMNDVDNIYKIKIGFAMALERAREGIYLLVPNSKRELIYKIFNKLDYVKYID